MKGCTFGNAWRQTQDIRGNLRFVSPTAQRIRVPSTPCRCSSCEKPIRENLLLFLSGSSRCVPEWRFMKTNTFPTERSTGSTPSLSPPWPPSSLFIIHLSALPRSSLSLPALSALSYTHCAYFSSTALSGNQRKPTEEDRMERILLEKWDWFWFRLYLKLHYTCSGNAQKFTAIRKTYIKP